MDTNNEITFMELMEQFDKDTRDCELVFNIASKVDALYFANLYREGKFNGYFIHKFIDAVVDKKNVAHHVCQLLQVYGVYLRDGIALVAFTETDEQLRYIKRWCRDFFINFNKVKIDRYVEEYCLTHEEILTEDDVCPRYWENKECDIMYDYTIKQTKIILHDEFHNGTFEELKFKWNNKHINGGYTIKF
jgi:hypothetical protein